MQSALRRGPRNPVCRRLSTQLSPRTLPVLARSLSVSTLYGQRFPLGSKAFSYDDYIESDSEIDHPNVCSPADDPPHVSSEVPSHRHYQQILRAEDGDAEPSFKQNPPRQLMLRNGVLLPALSLVLGADFGPHTTRRVIKSAIRLGYRSLDISNCHPGEEHIGQALHELFVNGEVDRDQLFISAKLNNANHRFVTEALKATLDRLRLQYVDAYLIGWPQACPATGKSPATTGCYVAPTCDNTMFPVDDNGIFCSDYDSHFVDTWHRMEELAEQERARAIGVCNFNAAQLREVYEQSYLHRPAILQVERHPYLQNRELMQMCRELDIQMQASIPTGSYEQILGRELGCVREDAQDATEDPLIVGLAREHGASPAQIILRWQLQSGVAVCAKAHPEEELAEYIGVWHSELELTADEMQSIDALDSNSRLMLWPETSGHPDYPFRDELPKKFRPNVPRYPVRRPQPQTRPDGESGKHAQIISPIHYA